MQATSDKTASANFTQTAETVKTNFGADAYSVTNGKTGYDLYYQFGRKDAFRSAQYTTAPAANTSLVYSATSVTVGVAIQNPAIFYGPTNPYNASFYYNAWNATATSGSTATTNDDFHNKVVKTIYDPCPVGYTVPPANTFTKFSTSNCTVSGKGRQYAENGKTLYFPYEGQRNIDSAALFQVGTTGTYWVAITSTTSRILVVDANRVTPAYIISNTTRALGYTVRPVREK